MNWDYIEGNWKQAKGKIKEQWGKLTDDELDVIAGKLIEINVKDEILHNKLNTLLVVLLQEEME